MFLLLSYPALLPPSTASPSPFHRIMFTFSCVAVIFHCFRCVFYDSSPSRSRGRASCHRSDDLVPIASIADNTVPRRQDLTSRRCVFAVVQMPLRRRTFACLHSLS